MAPKKRDICAVRISKEAQRLVTNPPPGLLLEEYSSSKEWIMKAFGAAGSIYEGEEFRLQIRFGDSYPIDSPEVIFLDPVPIHPHIYSNGHICLSILYAEWSPALTVGSVCLSILSMLSSCPKKIRPEGDAGYVARCRGRSPKDVRWVFDDDTV